MILEIVVAANVLFSLMLFVSVGHMYKILRGVNVAIGLIITVSDMIPKLEKRLEKEKSTPGGMN